MTDNNTTRPIVLTIAGTDPSGGAGIQADIKTISAIGCYAASAITALVAQNTCGVQAIQFIPSNFITQQLDSVFSDLNVAAVKIGMLHDEETMTLVAAALKKYAPPFVVLDPVMVAKNGSALLRPDAIAALKEIVFPFATLITPNLAEAEALTDAPVRTREAMLSTAIALGDQFGCHVLIKGGHLKSHYASDLLFDPEQGATQWFEAKRIVTRNTHGTGCSLSSAIAAYYAKGLNIQDAVTKAKHYITRAIASGSQQTIGQGNGPVDHFYFIE